MKHLAIIGLALLPLWVWGQSPKPEWYDATTRQLFYPEADYFVGYQSGFVRQGESLEAATLRLKTDAQGDAAQRIQVRVQSTTLDAVQSVQRQAATGLDEEITGLFQRQTTTSTTMEIPNLQALTWNDPTTGEVAVLVYTRRRDFVRFYDRQVESLLGKMEVALESALQQEQQGTQIKARETAQEGLLLCSEVEYAQRMVALADVNATMDDLQLPRYAALVKQLGDAVVRLRHAIAFYVDCKATIGDSPYSLLDKEVRGLLAEKGCQFTDNQRFADWIVTADASVINTEHREGMAYYVYVDGDIAVQNGRTGKRLLEDRLSALKADHYDGIKGGDFKADRAARMAYHAAARLIADAVLKLVQE